MKKLLFVIATLVLGINMVYGQEKKVFDVVEQMPHFPGGDAALIQFLKENIKYPEAAEKNGIQGRVICTFVVKDDGSVTNVQILRSVNNLLDNEAVRVIQAMPKWVPGKQNGEPVFVKYTLPITFKLDTPKSQPHMVKVVDTVVPDTTPVSTTKVFDVVEQMPQFGSYTYKKFIPDPQNPQKGTYVTKTESGTAGLLAFLNRNVKYPVKAEENGIQGRVLCSFVVERDGSITEVKVIRSVDPSLDKEAVRVIQSMPNWIPGMQKGQPVRVKFTLPVTFRLQ